MRRGCNGSIGLDVISLLIDIHNQFKNSNASSCLEVCNEDGRQLRMSLGMKGLELLAIRLKVENRAKVTGKLSRIISGLEKSQYSSYPR